MTFDPRTTELIAVGASVAANCASCLEYHVRKATEHDVDRQEIVDAIGVGRMVRRGAAAKIDELAGSLLRSDPASTAHGGTGACGCGVQPMPSGGGR